MSSNDNRGVGLGEVKHGRDDKLEADADKWLARGVGKNKRGLERDLEKVRYESGSVSAAELRFYDPTNNWDSKDSAYTIYVAPTDLEGVEPTACADGNVRARSREDPNLPDGTWGRAGAEELKGMRRHVEDDDSGGSTFEFIPLLGANEITSGKACTKCGLRKRLEYFSPDSRSGDGLHSWCKRCRKESARNAYVRKIE
ncbi:hypothetical protein SEA_POUND_154 [Mycobacterium phage Pound]|uniref:hypothetical protein n=1 Tax=Mycobacterium phage Redno2 TaxID=1340709 RepID=UPI000387AB57|nr:hypothetical protein N860_gp155 [Mycobacterium phage Redno2]QBJ00109.1 hypothetical protein SEA_PHOEBUS_162 [Mycobacterium phage Phoebus]QDM55741.1 hypothetical protein SEA_HOKKEND_156 [Mycobacterium phage HokkenD]QDM57978.1 hypothetical protein SEA_NIHILNOMEN_163 [Mycobacterium phage NihilNomen]QQM15310.1 hypothetical protein SEA_POUND_154 [Mycobacterium phage Pound]UEM46642.1 HNH endonuclease [Mycobacterium phage JuicyJay]WNM72706.1 hypothetical protein SEA_BOMBITAS_148 [Mycobacterium ph